MFGRFLPSLRKQNQEVARRDDEALDFFDAFFNAPFRGFPFDTPPMPAVDVQETDSEVVVTAELPGLDPKDVEMTLERDCLVLKGEKKFEREEKKDNLLRQERRYGSFRRAVPLPTGVKPEKVKASFKNGLLTVRLPKAEEAKPKRIEIS